MNTVYLRARVRRRVRAFSLNTILRAAFSIAFIICAGQQAAQCAPELISEANSTRAIALESVTWKREPFSSTQLIQFGVDSRTRIMLFAKNVDLLPGEDLSVVRAEAEDGSRTRYPLTVEYVGRVPGFEWMSSIVVRLHDGWGDLGDVLIGVSLRGVASNRVRVGIGHFASSDTNPNLPPMGMRVRLKASFDISRFSPAMQVVLKALKKYGMILADNGSNWYISGAPDSRWSDDELNTLKTVKGSDFEVVQMGTIVTQ